MTSPLGIFSLYDSVTLLLSVFVLISKHNIHWGLVALSDKGQHVCVAIWNGKCSEAHLDEHDFMHK